MLSRKLLLALLAILGIISSFSAVPVNQAVQDGQFFAETGHWVRGAFLDFYKNSTDPLLLFGYPITEEFDHPMRQGVKVQYFQRARMELETQPNGAARISLAPLGLYLYDNTQRGQKADFPITSGACRLFSSGKYVCYAFLTFYDAHGGATYFGQPISDVEVVDGRLVQYFDRTRLEWRPEMPAGQRVALTDVGRLDFDRTIGDPRIIDNVFAPQSQLTEIRVRAFPDRPLIVSGARQKIFVIVQDQYMQPVQGALVLVSVHLPNGVIENYNASQGTNSDGFTTVEFDVPSLKPNQVVELTVAANVVNGPAGQATTWFRVWW